MKGRKDRGGGFKGFQLPNSCFKQTTEMDYVTQNKKVILEPTLILLKKKKKTSKRQRKRRKRLSLQEILVNTERVIKIEHWYFTIHTVISDSGGAGYRRTSAEAAGRDAQSLNALPTEEAPTHDQEPGLSTTGAPGAHTVLPLRGDPGPMQRGRAPARTTCETKSD